VASTLEIKELRKLLGEEVPDGGDASDTLFTDVELAKYIDEAPDMDRAALEGWRRKAAHFSNLVDVTDGNSTRAMSDLMGHAMDMIKMYTRSAGGPTEGRTRIGRIRRT